MPTTLNSGLQLPDKGSVDWYSSMQTNYSLLDNHLENTDIHVTAEDKANWDSKQGSLSQAQLDAIAQVATNTDDIATLQSDKANASHTHSSSDITDIDDYATKDYVDNSISGLVDNAPDALNTLNELSAALNDDSNFASTVTTALAAKADSADLATVATSGSYNDLDDLPTIPTNTSDLNNDSNFVDTSNSAVASGITSAKVTDYDTHIADTDIHVTTADKNRWNNNTYVFRYSSTALTASSTNSNTLLDNTDNLKVGDKVIDSSGVLFSITAIDTQNSTFTIGTALIDLAQDSDVVHKSGNETVGGMKTFSNRAIFSTTSVDSELTLKQNAYDPATNGQSALSSTCSFNVTARSVTNGSFAQIGFYGAPGFTTTRLNCRYYTGASESDESWVEYTVTGTSGSITGRSFKPYNNGLVDLGTNANRWKSVYATNYYYGSNNVEFSDKFVTTDTAQTISGAKTFATSFDGIRFRCAHNSNAYITFGDSNQANPGSLILSAHDGNVGTAIHLVNKTLVPYNNNDTDLGSSSRSWKDFYSYHGYFRGQQQNDEYSVNARTNLTLLANRDTLGQSGCVVDTFRENTSQGTGSHILGFAIKENSVRYQGCRLSWHYDNDNNGYVFALRPTTQGSNQPIKYELGTSSSKWSTINGLNPSALGMPDLSNGIDISSYITVVANANKESLYTPPANGWISVRLSRTSGALGVLLIQGNMASSGKNIEVESGATTADAMLPVVGGVQVSINSALADGIVSAKFYPCQGNV